MGDQVEVPFGDNPSETATLLLAAAEELGVGQEVVKTQEGSFLVPSEVNDKAFAKPAKKTAAKKSAEKKG
jgi:hypothetical protein